MTANAAQIVAACLALVILTFIVGARLLFNRIREMREKGIHPHEIATSPQMAVRLEHVQAADNFRNLFEAPVLFYALAAVALATETTPNWLAAGAWLYVVLRLAHSFIHCTYNKVLHRLTAFLVSFVLVVALWVAFVITVLRGAA